MRNVYASTERRQILIYIAVIFTDLCFDLLRDQTKHSNGTNLHYEDRIEAIVKPRQKSIMSITHCCNINISI